MFANRYTALIDACSLAGVLKRNLLLSLAEAEFFRVRWSVTIMAETEKAIEKALAHRGHTDAAERARRSCEAMTAAFEEATVVEYEEFLPSCAGCPDPGDHHVVAAALKTQAAVIVTENLKHFPAAFLNSLNIEARNADTFIADTVSLAPGRAVLAIRCMRERFAQPEKTAGQLLIDMEADGLTQTVDALRAFEGSL